MKEKIFRDRFGEIEYDTATKVLRLTWSKETAGMSENEFKRWLSTFADMSQERITNFVVIDVLNFKYRPQPSLGKWRDENIIPMYNKAGIKKFAFLLPSGTAPASDPAPEGPAHFPTGYFDGEKAIYEWFEV
jgi:hypothetical protein